MLWILHSMVCKAEQRCTKYNVIFNQADVDRLYCIGTVCLRNDSNNCAAMICNDGVGLFAIGTAMIKSQHFQTMTLITKQKPIERLTDMVLMTKKSQIQAWPYGLYTENRYGQRMTSKHVLAGASKRPGTRDDKTQPNLSPSLAQWTIRRIRHFSSQSKSDFHYQDIVAPLQVCIEFMFLLLLSPAIQITSISWAYLQSVLLWKLCHFWNKPCSQAWIWEFLVIKTMSVNLSIGLCFVISVIVCKCCGLSVAMPMANSPTSSLQYNLFNHSTDAQYQWKIIIQNSGIYLIEKYILRSAPLFSFSNSRSAKSKTWLRAVALLQT